MKNLRNFLKKATALMLLTAILFTGSTTTPDYSDGDYSVMPLGGDTIWDVSEF